MAKAAVLMGQVLLIVLLPAAVGGTLTINDTTHHWGLAASWNDTTLAGSRNDMICQGGALDNLTCPLPCPCPTLAATPVFPGGRGATEFKTWTRGAGLRTQRPVVITKERAYTLWWQATMLPAAELVRQDIIFGGTCDYLGTLNDCAIYVAFWNASKPGCHRTAPPYVPHCGPLLTFVFSRNNSQWVQYCTNPMNFSVTAHESHFLGFSSSGIDQSTFHFVYDGVDRTSELYLCSQGAGTHAEKDPSGLAMNLRVGVQGGARCSTHGAACDSFQGYVGGVRWYNRTLSSAELISIYEEEVSPAWPPAPVPPPPKPTVVAALPPTPVQRSWADRELGALVTWGVNNVIGRNASTQNCDWDNRSQLGCKSSGPAMCSGCDWDLPSLPAVREFDPVKLDITGWVQAAASFGAKYLVLSAMHCSGFALWPTHAKIPGYGRYNYSVASARGAWTRHRTSTDIVQEFVRACRQAEILPGLYVNLGLNMYMNIGANSDAHSVDPGGRFEACGADGRRALKPGQVNVSRPAYFAVMLEMMAELLSEYGELAEIWFDGGVPLEMSESIAELLDAMQPSAVAFQGPNRKGSGFSGNVVRWSGTESGHTPASNMWSTIPPGANGVQQMAWGAGSKPDDGAAGLEFVPAEQDGAIQQHNMGGFWYPGATSKPMSELMREYEDSVGHNSNFLLELSPDPNGQIPPDDVAAYHAFGQALQRCYRGADAAKQEISNVSGLVFELPAAPTSVDRVLISEDMQRCGQRVTGFELSAQRPGDNATWELIGQEQSIGHCRIQRIAAVAVGTRIRLNITAVAAVSDPGCGSGAAQLRRMASFDMAGCMADVDSV